MPRIYRPSDVAQKYIGKTEKPQNSGFNDLEFERKMAQVGVQQGQAWCCYFAELVFKEALPDQFKELDRLFSGSTLTTYRNFLENDYEITMTPFADALVIFQHYKNGQPQITGHAGVVLEAINGWEFRDIEGNTTDGGSREGYIVAPQRRKVLAEVNNGLKVKGFIKIAK